MEMQVNDQERLTRKRLRRAETALEGAKVVIESLLSDVESLDDIVETQRRELEERGSALIMAHGTIRELTAKLEQSEKLRLANQ